MALQPETTEALRRLIRFNTVNPPGNARSALEYLASYVGEAGFEEALAQHPGITLTVKNRYGGATSDTAQTESYKHSEHRGDGEYCVEGRPDPEDAPHVEMLQRNNLVAVVLQAQQRRDQITGQHEENGDAETAWREVEPDVADEDETDTDRPDTVEGGPMVT